MDNKELTLKTIDFLRFPLMVLIVFIHNPGTPPAGDYFSSFNPTFYNIFRYSIIEIISRLAVPAFFLISGYLFFFNIKSWNIISYKKKIVKRFKTLIVPYIIWNLIPILISAFFYIKSYFLQGLPLTSITDWFIEKGGLYSFFWGGYYETSWNTFFGSNSLSMPINAPLWYLRDLIVVSLMTPLFFWLIKNGRTYYLIVISILYILDVWPNIPGIDDQAVVFFNIGAYFSINNIDIIQKCQNNFNITFFATLIFFILDILQPCLCMHIYFVHALFIFWGIKSLFYIVSKLVEQGFETNKTLMKASFFIYLIHVTTFIGIYDVIINRYVENLQYQFIAFIHFIITPFIKIAMCVALYVFLNTYTPNLLSILSGNRNQNR